MFSRIEEKSFKLLDIIDSCNNSLDNIEIRCLR